jgi:hypothetical protein
MKRKLFASFTILFLITILGYQLIDLINYINAPKAISLDNEVEAPKLIDLSDNNTTVKKQKKSDPRTYKKRPKNLSEQDSKKTKPMHKNKFLSVIRVAEEEYKYSKEDYEGQLNKKARNQLITFESNWEKKVLESETLIEKSLKQAAQVKNQGQPGTIQNYKTYEKGMERYAIKIELPSSTEGTKFKLQYREPPDFGKSQLPTPVLAKTKVNKSATFSIEKTTTTDSPWDNFSGNKIYP